MGVSARGYFLHPNGRPRPFFFFFGSSEKSWEPDALPSEVSFSPGTGFGGGGGSNFLTKAAVLLLGVGKIGEGGGKGVGEGGNEEWGEAPLD